MLPDFDNLASALTLVATFAGGAIWVGTIDNQSHVHEVRIEKLEQESPAVDIGVLKASQARIEQDIQEIKSDQKNILQELRKDTNVIPYSRRIPSR